MNNSALISGRRHGKSYYGEAATLNREVLKFAYNKLMMEGSGLDPLNSFHVFVFYCKNNKLKEILRRYV